MSDFPNPDLLNLILANVTKQTGQPATLREYKPTTWPNSAIGLPKQGYMYLQVLTPGQIVYVESGGRLFTYHTGRNNFKMAREEYYIADK